MAPQIVVTGTGALNRLFLSAALLLAACSATDQPAGPAADELPAPGELTREAPVMVYELDGPTFLAVYDPAVISDDGVLWHSHKNCPDTPKNYAFPVSEPLPIRNDLRRVTMACQYGFK